MRRAVPSSPLPCGTLPPHDPASYALLSLGKCDGDWGFVETEADCNAAAKAVGLQKTAESVASAGNTGHPYGCYHATGEGKLVFNAHGTRENDDQARPSLCKGVHESQPTLAARPCCHLCAKHGLVARCARPACVPVPSLPHRLLPAGIVAARVPCPRRAAVPRAQRRGRLQGALHLKSITAALGPVVHTALDPAAASYSYTRRGTCKQGAYAGEGSTPGATVDSCAKTCLADLKCLYFAVAPGDPILQCLRILCARSPARPRVVLVPPPAPSAG